MDHSIVKFIALQKSRHGRTSEPMRRKIRAFESLLHVHIARLCTRYKVRRRGTLPELVSRFAGRPLSYMDAWEWLLESYEAEPQREPWEWHDQVVKELRAGFRRERRRAEERKVQHLAQQAQLAAQQIPGAEFYQSLAWRELRYKVLKKSDGVCEACRRSAKDHGVALHVDHIFPRSEYPDLALEETNLQVLCDDCNIGKGVTDTTDWRAANSNDPTTKVAVVGQFEIRRH